MQVKDKKGRVSDPSPSCKKIFFEELAPVQNLTINQGTVSWKECSDCKGYVGFWGVYGQPGAANRFSFDKNVVNYTMSGLKKGTRYRFCIRSKSCYESSMPYSCVDEVVSSGETELMEKKSQVSAVKLGRPMRGQVMFEAKQEYCDWRGV